MSPLEAAVLVALCALPFHVLLLRERAKLTDPAYLRRRGVVVTAERALQARAAPIGTYMGHEIWSSVTFMGMVYRYDRVAPPAYRDRVRPRELFLEPGLVYVTA